MLLLNTVKNLLRSAELSCLTRRAVFTVVLLMLVTTGCTSLKIAELPPPDAYVSDSVREVEAVLTGRSAEKSPEVRTRKVLRLEAKAAKLAIKASLLEVKLHALAQQVNAYDLIMDEVDLEVKNAKHRIETFRIDRVTEGDKAVKKIEVAVQEIMALNKILKSSKKHSEKLVPKFRKLKSKARILREKERYERQEAAELMSELQVKLAKKHASKLVKVVVADIVARSEGANILLLGEVHSSTLHHEFQLEVITALVASGRKVAVGMEMFMVDSQEKLNEWVDGSLEFEDFRVLYYVNWKTPWVKYAPLLMYVKEKQIDLVALSIERSAVKRAFEKQSGEANVPQGAATGRAQEGEDEVKKEVVESIEGIGEDGEVTERVAVLIEAEIDAELEVALYVEEEEEELSILMTNEELKAVTCEIEPEYIGMLHDAIGEHSKGMNFDMTRFCRIQRTWDIAMAKSAKEYIEDNPEGILVAIVGGMHAWKRGIPKQLLRLGSESIQELADARIVAKKAKKVTREAKASFTRAQEEVASAEGIAARARRTAREAFAQSKKSTSPVEPQADFMGISAGGEKDKQSVLSSAVAVDLEMLTDVSAASDLARHNVEVASERLKVLEDEYKAVLGESKKASKRLKKLKKSKSDFKSVVVIPEMPQYRYFRSGGATTDDADYILLH